MIYRFGSPVGTDVPLSSLRHMQLLSNDELHNIRVIKIDCFGTSSLIVYCVYHAPNAVEDRSRSTPYANSRKLLPAWSYVHSILSGGDKIFWMNIRQIHSVGNITIAPWVEYAQPSSVAGFELASGWPFRAVVSQWKYHDNLESNFRGPVVMELKGDFYWALRRADPMVFPQKVIWRGMVGNAAIAILLALLVFNVPLLRRFYRTRRGLCYMCGYSRASLAAGSPCPECGEISSARGLRSHAPASPEPPAHA